MRDEELERITECNLCGSRDIEDVYASTWVRRCRACGYVFRSPRPTVEAIAAFYSREGKYSHWLGEMPGRDACWRYRLGRLRRFVKFGRLLDVGAGIGEFLARARGHFDGTGTEVSEEAIRLARERFGIELLRGTLEHIRGLEPASFDAVSLIHVLEHVPDPAATIARCRDLLRPGGCLFVAVPNDSAAGWHRHYWGARRTYRRLFRPNLRQIQYCLTPPFGSVDLRNASANTEIHLSHFSPECLRAFLSRSGYNVLAMGPDPCFTSTGFRRLRDNLDMQAARWLHAATGLYCYDAMWMAASSRLP